jgi:hypothetical protein
MREKGQIQYQIRFSLIYSVVDRFSIQPMDIDLILLRGSKGLLIVWSRNKIFYFAKSEITRKVILISGNFVALFS